MKNIGGSYGGALTAGLFLQEFVDGAPWVHLDIAGPARVERRRRLPPEGRDRVRRAHAGRAGRTRSSRRPAGGQPATRHRESGRHEDSRAQGGDAEVHDPEGCRRSTRTRASVRFRSGALVAALALVAPALVFVASPAAARVPSEDNVVTVHIRDNMFSPVEPRRRDRGTTVRWVNDGRNDHNVTPDVAATPSAAEPRARASRTRVRFPDAGDLRLLLHAARHADERAARPASSSVTPSVPPRSTPSAGATHQPPTFARVGSHDPRSRRREDGPGRRRPRPAGRPRARVARRLPRETVTIATDGVVIRGIDRNRTILDGEFERDNGVFVLGADGVAIENLTTAELHRERVLLERRARIPGLVRHRLPQR